MVRLEYKVVVQEAEVTRFKSRLTDEKALNSKFSRVGTGEMIYRVEVEVKSPEHRQNVEKLIRGNKTDIVGSYLVLETENAKDVKEKFSIKFGKDLMKFAIAYAIIFPNIIIPTLQSVKWDTTTLTNGTFSWWLVLLVSIPSAFGTAFGLNKLPTNPET